MEEFPVLIYLFNVSTLLPWIIIYVDGIVFFLFSLAFHLLICVLLFSLHLSTAVADDFSISWDVSFISFLSPE